MKAIVSYLCFIALLCNVNPLKAQTDTVPANITYNVALVLPFEGQETLDKIDQIVNATDLYTANHIRINEEAIIALDFYQGLLLALNEDGDSVKVNLHVYDTWDSDSATAVLLKKPELKKMDFIIGSVSSSCSRLIAEFCKANKILNLQPFTPSKSLTTANPYHLKIAPTIDAHIDDMFQSILDSFIDANIIIYTPKNERSLPVAERFDSLFTNYNATATIKYNVSLLNITDQTVKGKKTDLQDLLNSVKPNVLIITSYDEPFVQSTLHTIFEKKGKADVVVYGMPTWLSGEVLRLDYINDLNTRISDAFWADTFNTNVKAFDQKYTSSFYIEPTKYAYLGYDVLNFLLRSVKTYGKDFLPQLATQRYTGLGYKFDITKVMKDPDTINYYENTHVNVLAVTDYRLKKVW